MAVREPSARYLTSTDHKRSDSGPFPEPWKRTTVTSIASSVRNAIVGGPFGSDLVSKDYVEFGVPVVRGQNMGNKYVSGNFAFVTRGKANSLHANLARPGDLMFTQRGTLGQVSIVPDMPFKEYLVSQSQMKLTIDRKAANPEFFYYVFNSSEQQEYIRRNTIQTGLPHINLGILKSIPVPLPQPDEQAAIAEALSNADSYIESLEKLLAKKRHLKQGAMQELLTGRRRLIDFHGEWKERFLGEIASVSKGTQLHSDETDIGETFAHLNGGISPSGYTSKSNTVGNTIAISEGGNSCGFVQYMKDPYWCGGHCYSVVPNSVDNQYLYQALKSKQSSVMALRVGSGLPNVQKTSLLALRLPVPEEVAEQTAIASILSDMDAEIAALESKLTKARQIKQGMMQELLTGRIRLI